MVKKLTILILLTLIFPTKILLAQEKDEDIFLSEDFFTAPSQKNNSHKINDPFEKTNRKIFAFNETVDIYLFRPVAKTYKKILPSKIKSSIRNFSTNIAQPVTIVNSLLQGKFNNALKSSSSFLINTTIGIGGIINFASKKNITPNKEDFGQTLASYNIKNGPYLVIPFFGPSTLRDASGLLIDNSLDPTSLNLLKVGGKRNLTNGNLRLTHRSLSAIDSRSQLIEIIDDLRETSFDFYTTAKSSYIQNRNNKINQ